ncbi:hypothetical protein J4229_00785 [Candidatus Pacearchaeota archaeon]|nr:hypothetical protein [Candidatus Pacearchaeota archaeon]
MFDKNKKGQVAIFVIIALVIVGGIITFYAFREQIFAKQIPAELRPVFDYYKSCVEDESKTALDLAGSQGGFVSPGEYIPGSEYAPFSSQLNFLGFPVPYWFYLSGNGLVKENVPQKSQIENEISIYIEENLDDRCNFDEFYAKGFSIDLGTPKVKTTIQDSKVVVSIGMNTIVSKDESSARKTFENVEVVSNFGKMYRTAVEIYNKEKRDSFLENYSVDVLRTYAPVDGVEIGCSGKIWKTREVIEELKNGLEANIAAIKFKGEYYTPQSKEKSYYIVDLPVSEHINLIYSKEWPTKVEIAGADDELMVAEPVGNQEGMGVMGFCYSPYHFVYDVGYPVLVQIIDGSEVFQFPVVVVIDKNMPREGIYSEIPTDEESIDACKYNTQDVSVNVYDTQLNKVDANLSYGCFNQLCELGSSENGVFSGKVPACYNGYIKAVADGYAEKSQIFSTNEESVSDVILDREYDVAIYLKNAGKELSGNAIITFSGQKSASALLPDSRNVKLSEGFYNISVYVYANSSLTLPSYTKRQCSEVPKGAIGGLFGLTEQKCFDVVIPETKMESALIGGGKSEIYLLPMDLEKGELKLEVGTLPVPNSIEQLQSNYQLFETLNVGVVE